VDVFLGRQPILDTQCNVVAYELLCRSSEANFCDLTDDVTATSQVIVNAVLGVGLDRLLGGKPAFINFDRTLLLGDWTTLLPPDKVVIEILETVPPDPEVLAACHRLQEQGYALALDDCLDDGRTAAFLPFVDTLKVDFQQTSKAEQENIALRSKQLKVGLIAEKVETEPEFRSARQQGYDYFQGYFFARPTVLRGARIHVSQINGLRLMKHIQREELDFQAVEEIIRHDVGFSHSLLTYLNSAAFNWANRIESVRQGLFLLGSDEVRKWGWMSSLSSLGKSKPKILMTQVLMRGRFCEAIVKSARSLGAADPFLVGMFSLLDAILERPLPGILDDLNIGTNIRSVLLGTAGDADTLALALQIARAYEVGDWHKVITATQAIGLSADALNTCYLESLFWVESVFPTDDQNGRSEHLSHPIDFHRQSKASPSKLA
jgi:c-di-GMP-related signal transduction protein